MLAEYFRFWSFSRYPWRWAWSCSRPAEYSARAPDSEKASPYECGFEAFEDTRSKFDVRYYLVAILFIIFDLEIPFFIPCALQTVQGAKFCHGCGTALEPVLKCASCGSKLPVNEPVCSQCGYRN